VTHHIHVFTRRRHQENRSLDPVTIEFLSEPAMSPRLKERMNVNVRRVRSGNSVKYIPSSLGSDGDLVSPTVPNRSDLLVLLLLFQEFQPLANRLGLGVDCSWEFLEVIVSFLVSSDQVSAVSSVLEMM
jgi:hypothetical protein